MTGLLGLLSVSAVWGDSTFVDVPDPFAAAHLNGRLAMPFNNRGIIGDPNVAGPNVDPFSGKLMVHTTFPYGSDMTYTQFCGPGMGVVAEGDSIFAAVVNPVMGWNNFRAVVAPMDYRSSVAKDESRRTGAVSEWDLYFTTADTIFVYFHPQEIAGIQISQSSYSWSLPGVRDIVFVHYIFKNISDKTWSAASPGVYLPSNVVEMSYAYYDEDDFAGLRRIARQESAATSDSLSYIWLADGDGNSLRALDDTSVGALPHAFGCVGLNTTNDRPMHFRWWAYSHDAEQDISPVRSDDPYEWLDIATVDVWTWEDPFATWLYGSGRNDMDVAYYWKVTSESSEWRNPESSLDGFSDPEIVYSYGPVTMAPGDTISMTLAFIGGENFHTNFSNYRQNMVALYDPDAYYSHLDFSDLDFKARIAARVYDNPGIDTDGNGYAGEFVMDDDDTVWLSGDGVPDWRPALPPAPPQAIRVEYDGDSAVVRFNGLAAETAPDRIVGLNLFEGYRVYRGTSPDSLALVNTWDRANFVRYDYNSIGGWLSHYQLFTIEELRCAYGSSCDDASFEPLAYAPSHPMIISADSIVYFERYGLNNSLGANALHKRYPDQPYPSTLDPSNATPEELTPDGLLKYFEYQYVVRNLSAGDTVYLSFRSIGSGPAALFEAIPESDGAAGLVPIVDPSSCCVGMRGNFDGSAEDEPGPIDLSIFVDLLFSGGEQPPCDAEVDVNGDGEIGDGVDLSYLVDFLFSGGSAPPPCP